MLKIEQSGLSVASPLYTVLLQYSCTRWHRIMVHRQINQSGFFVNIVTVFYRKLSSISIKNRIMIRRDIGGI